MHFWLFCVFICIKYSLLIVVNQTCCELLIDFNPMPVDVTMFSCCMEGEVAAGKIKNKKSTRSSEPREENYSLCKNLCSPVSLLHPGVVIACMLAGEKVGAGKLQKFTSYNFTEPQNGWRLEGTSGDCLQAESARPGCKGPCPVKFWVGWRLHKLSERPVPSPAQFHRYHSKKTTVTTTNFCIFSCHFLYFSLCPLSQLLSLNTT